MKCPNCNETFPEGNKFCFYCGGPLVEEAVNEAPVSPVCPKCGRALSGKEKFCATCGTPLQGNDAPKVAASPAPAPQKAPAPAQAAPVEPQQDKSKSKSKAPIIAIVAVVLVALIAGAFLILGKDAPASSSSAKSAANASFTGITAATASSYLPHDDTINTKYYTPDLVLDKDLSTCWAAKHSTGDTITLSGTDAQTFSGFTIRTGFQANEERYSVNTRPREIKISADGKQIAVATLEDAGLNAQKVSFNPVVAKSLSIEIVSVYQGSKFKECCITEIECF